MIVAATPSRGLIHSRTVEAVMGNLESAGRGWRWAVTHDLPIPDSHNVVVEQALSYRSVSLIWMVEEDVVPQPGTLLQMIRLLDTVPVLQAVTVTYTLPGGIPSTVEMHGKRLFSGLGCCLFQASVFQELGRPWFRSDTSWGWTGSEFIPRPGGVGYGGHDVDFFVRSGIRWETLDGVEAHHLRVKQLGTPQSNEGCHVVEKLGSRR